MEGLSRLSLKFGVGEARKVRASRDFRGKAVFVNGANLRRETEPLELAVPSHEEREILGLLDRGIL